MKRIIYSAFLALIIAALMTGRTCGRNDDLPAGKREEKTSVSEAILALKRTGKAFSSVAGKAIPAVVFIHVEKTIETGAYGGRGQYNDPMDFFGDEFLRRFFGPRYERPPMKYRQEGQGSGFIISSDGYILTNNHVVGDADKITVKLSDGREMNARRIGSDPLSEVAVIKIEADNLPFLELGNSSELEIGEWVIAVGNPFGLTETVTVGVVSAKGRSNLKIAEYEDFIQTDAAINPGNSGGPLLDIEGKVIGINTAIFSQSGGYMGIGFAIPVNMAKAIKNQLIANGRVVRGFLGVQLNPREVDNDIAESFGLDNAGGALVAEVVPGTPAEEAKIESGDIILEVNGAPVENNASLRNMIALLKPGSKASFTVFRKGRKIEIEVVIGAVQDESNNKHGGRAVSEKLGIAVTDIPDEIADRMGYHRLEGALVEQVRENSEADKKGIRPGHLILSVNRIRIKNAGDYYKALQNVPGGRSVLMRIRGPEGSRFAVLRTD